MLAGWCMRGVLIPRVLGVFRLRSVRLSKHRAHCNALLQSRGHRADSQLRQRNQRGGPAQLRRRPRPRPGPPAFSSSNPFSIAVTSRLGEQRQSLETEKEGQEKEGQRERPEQLVHPGLCGLPAGDSQREWGMCARLCQDFMSYTWRAMWKCFLCTVYHALFFFPPLFLLLPPSSLPLSLYRCFQELKVCFSFQWQSIPWLLNVNQWQAAGWHERLQLLVGHCSSGLL